jgi:tetratricopeptide (TPR) repeat protein
MTRERMTRDNIVFTGFGFLLGLVIGGMVIGPKLAQSKLAGAQQPAAAEAPAAAAAPAVASATGGSPMGAVFQQINNLKQEIERDPNNATALAQLGTMYMDAGKFPQAIEYFERALKVRDDPQVRTDLGICYRNNNEPDKSLAQFRQVVQAHPDQWQALFNEVIILAELRHIDEAKSELAKLQQLRPGDPDVAKLATELANAR